MYTMGWVPQNPPSFRRWMMTWFTPRSTITIEFPPQTRLTINPTCFSLTQHGGNASLPEIQSWQKTNILLLSETVVLSHGVCNLGRKYGVPKLIWDIVTQFWGVGLVRAIDALCGWFSSGLNLASLELAGRICWSFFGRSLKRQTPDPLTHSLPS